MKLHTIGALHEYLQHRKRSMQTSVLLTFRLSLDHWPLLQSPSPYLNRLRIRTLFVNKVILE